MLDSVLFAWMDRWVFTNEQSGGPLNGWINMYSCVCIHSVLAGVIVTARRFDRERQREYSVTVTATDWAEEPLIGICQLTVQILDQNDNSPKFENLRYECKCLVKMIYVGLIGERLLNIIISAIEKLG